MATLGTGFNFGPWVCRWSEAFYLSSHSLAMVNHKPIVPGHCLVVSRRVAARVSDLTPSELSDLWTVACLVSKPLERHFGAQALTFAIQDGSAAGQTVPHVHIHILPRRKGDFEDNDLVYGELNKANLSRTLPVDAKKGRKPRSPQEMAQEAGVLRNLFVNSLPIPVE